MLITVPPPSDTPNTTSWRKTITALTDAKGGNAIEGVFLQPSDVVDIPTGTLILTVDKTTTGWDYGYRTGERYALKDATIAVHITTTDGLTELWHRHYKSDRAAFGATTMKKLTALLSKHPAPGGDITVVEEARRPNRKSAECRWCHAQLPSGTGHLVGHGNDVEAEHWQSCPVQRTYAGTCELCGVTIAPTTPAGVMLIREGVGRRSLRHLPEVCCTERTPVSAEEYTAMSAAITRTAAEERAEQAEKERRAAERKEQRAAARKAAVEAAERAEVARVAELAETGRSVVNINSKNLGGSLRAKLDEITISLSDGTTTTRWVVSTYSTGTGWTGEDYDPDPGEEQEYTSKTAARAAYRALRFQPSGRHDYDTHGVGWGVGCAECGWRRAEYQRHDSSGIPGKVCARCNRLEDYELSFG